jgi:hypothetical protein
VVWRHVSGKSRCAASEESLRDIGVEINAVTSNSSFVSLCRIVV